MFPSVTMVMLLHKSRHLKSSIIETLGMFDRFVVVDNASQDGLIDELAHLLPHGTYIRSDVNRGFGGGNNLGLEHVRSEYCLVANPDATFDASTIQQALELHQAYPRVGAVGARIFANRQDEKASFDWDYEPRYSRSFVPLEGVVCTKWIYGCFMLLNTEAFRSVGFFDERFFLYYEEWDVCRRLNSGGFQVLASPEVRVAHTDGQSSLPSFGTKFRREYHWLRSKRRYLQKFPHPHYKERPRAILVAHGLVAFIFSVVFLRKIAMIKALARLRVGLTG